MTQEGAARGTSMMEVAQRIAIDAQQDSLEASIPAATLEELIRTHPVIKQAYLQGLREQFPEDAAIEDHLRAVLVLLGLDPTNQHFLLTPERVAKVWRSYVQPDTDLQEVLSAGFDDDPGEENGGHEKNLVVQAPIPFFGFCAHHLLPFFGTAAVGYLPRARVVGLSKLTRLVYAAGHIGPSTQEHITNLIADALHGSDNIQPKGVAVLTSALHGCMASRGVETPENYTFTSAVRGAFTDTPALEQKFMDLALLRIGGRR